MFAAAAGVHVFISVVIFLWFVILLFLIDVNMYVYNVTMFTTCLDFGS